MVEVALVEVELVEVRESMIDVVSRARVAKKFVEVAEVEVELTVTRLVIVEVALFTMIGTEVVGESAPKASSHDCPKEDPQAVVPTKPEAMFRHPFARVSIRKTEVEATPLTVRAVVEAYGKTDFVVEVAMM